MTDFSSALTITASGLRAQAQRLRFVSENIANVDTPGYHRKVVSFVASFAEADKTGLVETGRVSIDQSDPERIYDPAHPLADASGYYDGSNVNLMIELADAREAQRSYEANLKMFEQTRQMGRSLFDLLRR